MQPTIVQTALDKPLFDPSYLNLEYIFTKIVEYIKPIYNIIIDPHTWTVVGFVSAICSVIFISIIIFALVRMREIQLHEKMEINHEINEALLRDKEKSRNENQKWNYILTLIESPNESDWRMSIMEADTLLEESLKGKELTGNTVAELLEEARSSGYASIQNAWDAHLIRNKIAHEGSDYPLSQTEGRRVIKMFQNFFEELKII
jgi:hypothetical protein